ncbi:hypothetical protein BXU11_07630 [Flavobacterium sp. LM5]|nr:hypothetical protein BXU11_07630 [Flavobacterium sp. LM5]
MDAFFGNKNMKLVSQRRRGAKSGMLKYSIGMGFSPFFTMSLVIGFSQNCTLVSAKAFASLSLCHPAKAGCN